MDLIWVDTDKSVDPAREYKTKRQGKIQRALPASQLFSAMPPLEAVKMLVSSMMSINFSNLGNPLKSRHYDINRAHFQGTPRDSFTSSRLKHDADKILSDWSRSCTELKMLPTSGNLIT